MRTVAALVTLGLLVVAMPSGAQGPSWHLTATVAESCSCVVPCPLHFGGEPSHMPCEGNRMISIEQGHYGDVDLAGVQAAGDLQHADLVEGLRERQGERPQMKALEG